MTYRKINVANPSEKDWQTHRFLLWFGAYGSTYILAYGHLEDALEAAAEWLLENAPGHLMPIFGEEHTTLMRGACEEMGLPWPIKDGECWDDRYQKAEDSTVVDMTHTESGYLCSWEWGIVFEDPTNQQLSDFAHGMKRQSQTAELADLILKHRDDPKTPWRGSGHYEGIARGLVRAAKELSRIAERQCSENMPEATARRVEAREAHLQAHIKRLCASINVGVTFSGDPRGYVVKLHFGPSPKEQPGNSWGGAECGWGIG